MFVKHTYEIWYCPPSSWYLNGDNEEEKNHKTVISVDF
jgi:hypothetical protein